MQGKPFIISRLDSTQLNVRIKLFQSVSLKGGAGEQSKW